MESAEALDALQEIGKELHRIADFLEYDLAPWMKVMEDDRDSEKDDDGQTTTR